VCAVVLTLSALVLGSGGTSFAAPGHASSLSIALSNSYAGNSWRQQIILQHWSAVTIEKTLRGLRPKGRRGMRRAATSSAPAWVD
jgi:hypothetical protein